MNTVTFFFFLLVFVLATAKKVGDGCSGSSSSCGHNKCCYCGGTKDSRTCIGRPRNEAHGNDCKWCIAHDHYVDDPRILYLMRAYNCEATDKVKQNGILSTENLRKMGIKTSNRGGGLTYWVYTQVVTSVGATGSITSIFPNYGHCIVFLSPEALKGRAKDIMITKNHFYGSYSTMPYDQHTIYIGDAAVAELTKKKEGNYKDIKPNKMTINDALIEVSKTFRHEVLFWGNIDKKFILGMYDAKKHKNVYPKNNPSLEEIRQWGLGGAAHVGLVQQLQYNAYDDDYDADYYDDDDEYAEYDGDDYDDDYDEYDYDDDDDDEYDEYDEYDGYDDDDYDDDYDGNGDS